MENGSYVYYVVQQRLWAKGEWGRLESKIKPEKNMDEFSTCGDDYFGTGVNPRGKDWKAKFPAESKEHKEVRHKCSDCGWWDLKYAKAAIARLRKLDAAGEFDYRDGYGTINQRCRYQFRILQVYLTYSRIESPLKEEAKP